ncbi:unnamed protein product [Leptidea sinapis]|uniref:Uncharacterized protein n=1 Tax=Leptidea sinapis TaxID=189913 RepID=A0A5E4PN79_9NEOP|nr:unnamed protein product [Leptidea sinapis]
MTQKWQRREISNFEYLMADVQRPQPIPRVPVGAHQLRERRAGPEPALQLQGPLQAHRRAQPEPARVLRGAVRPVGAREPMTTMFLALHGGKFDHPNRLS